MGMVQCFLGGLIGAAVGVTAWVLVGYFAHYEIGWIAWGVGFLAGFGVRYAAFQYNEAEASAAKGILAAVIAIAAILAGKYTVFWLMTRGVDHQRLQHLAAEMARFDDEGMTVGIARELAGEAAARGETLAWPEGMSAEKASKPGDFPPAIWQAADTQWKQTGPKERQELTRRRLMLAGTLSELGRGLSFENAFAPLDLLWFGLAIVTAFRVGVGSYGND